MLERDQMTQHDRRLHATKNIFVIGGGASDSTTPTSREGELEMIEMGGDSRGDGSGGKGTICASPIMIKELI